MKTASVRTLVLALLLSGFGVETSAQAGVIPWAYNAIFGYGPVFPRRHGYTVGYQPLAPYAAGPWSARSSYYRGGYFAASPVWSGQASSYYGPVYSGGSFAAANCGCDPCGYSSCGPCGTGCNASACISDCGTGDCSTGETTYSPQPDNSTADNSSNEVIPTFKPTPAEPDDDFRPVNKKQDSEFVAPQRGIAESESPGSTNSATEDTGNSNAAGLLEIDDSSQPMPPIERPITPAGGASTGSTIPEIPRTTIPDRADSSIPSPIESTIPPRSTIPENRRPFPPASDSTAPIFNPEFRPAPIDPTEETDGGVFPESTATPIELDTRQLTHVNVPRERIVVKARYRAPQVSRIDVPPTPIRDAGSTNVAIR